MKPTILLAALAALTCPIWAQEIAPAGRVTNPALLADPDKPAKPSLTPEQKLAIRDAQVPMLNASREFQAYMQTIQKQLEALPEYTKLKAAAETASAKFQAVAQEAVKKTCADCQLDVETLNLTRPQQAKVEKPAEKK